jgi:two-component system chemotaxis response regulator CheB
LAKRDVVLVGASAGGVEALRDFVAGLPLDFPASVLVVLHVPPTGSSALPGILSRAGPLLARHAREGDVLDGGTILVAPPDRHLIVYDDSVTLSLGPRENGHRPAVDVLFRSAARALGPRAVGIVLSGALDDGAAGMLALKLAGGVGIAQEPEDALHASMPRAAIAAGGVDHVLPVAKMPSLVGALLREEVSPDPPGEPPLMDVETAMAERDEQALNSIDPPGEPSGLTCPDCHGSLFEIKEGGLVRYRCRVGHAWSPGSLVAQQSASHESALWIALRSLQEKAALTRELGERAATQGHRLTAESFERQAEDALRAAALVRELIEQISGATPVFDDARESE